MDPTIAAPTTVRVLNWLRSMPDWFKATVLGAACVIVTLLVMSDGTLAADVATNRADNIRNKTKVESMQHQLDRMEGKIDRLLLKLIPTPD